MTVQSGDTLVNISKSLVFICFFYSFFKLHKKNKEHQLLFMVLCVSSANEIMSRIAYFHPFHTPWFTSLNLALHQFIWIALITQHSFTNKRLYFFTAAVIFAIADFLFIEGPKKINCLTFVFLSMIYISIFCFSCFKWMKNEDITAFTSNRFLLLCAPLLFSFGMTALLGFRSRELSNTPMGMFSLYNLVNFSGNLIYYGLVFIYLTLLKPTPKHVV